MDYSARVLGGTAVRYLRDRATAAVLTIGSDAFARGDLARVACFHYQAAANLGKVLAVLGATSTRDVFDRIPPESLAVPGVGAIALAVLGAAFEAKRIGGDAPLETWIAKHRPKSPIVTFVTLKHRDAKEHAAERQAKRDRQRARRNTAHAIRKARFHQRRQASTPRAVRSVTK